MISRQGHVQIKEKKTTLDLKKNLNSSNHREGNQQLKLLPITDIDVGLVNAWEFVFGGQKYDFLILKIIFSSTKNKLSDVSKEQDLDISNGQEFELLTY